MDDPGLTTRPATKPAAPSLARVSLLPWGLFLVALAAAAFFAWKWWQPEDLGDPLATSLVAFEKQDKLTVFSAELALSYRATIPACSASSIPNRSQ